MDLVANYLAGAFFLLIHQGHEVFVSNVEIEQFLVHQFYVHRDHVFLTGTIVLSLISFSNHLLDQLHLIAHHTKLAVIVPKFTRQFTFDHHELK